MSEFFEKIPLQQLRPGMYVNDVFNETGIFLFTVKNKITGYHQIESLRRQTVGFCSIIRENHTGRIEQVVSASNGWLNSQQHQNLKKVNLNRKKIIKTVKEFMASVKTGRFFSYGTLSLTIENLIEQVLDSTDSYLGLCQIKSYNDELYTHSVNTAVLTSALGSHFGYSRDKILEMCTGALLHDIGKIGLPDFLIKKAIYNSDEMEQIKRHPLLGIKILKQNCRNIAPVSLSVIGQHHERINGSGYPNCLKGSQIDESAMLCAVCDIYDNLTTEKGKRKACLPQEALALIFQVVDEEYPRNLIENFTKLLGIYPVGSFVRLESGEMGVVTKTNRQTLLFPQILILFDTSGERLNNPFLRDISKTDQLNGNHRIKCSLDPQLFKIDPLNVLIRG